MPSLFFFLGYRVFFWSMENDEPIHVHVCKGNPRSGSTKIWLLQKGGCLIASNDARIPEKDLQKLKDAIDAQRFFICRRWKEHFAIDEIKYYC